MEPQEVLSRIGLSLFQSLTISDTEERPQVLTAQDQGQGYKKDCQKGEIPWDLDKDDEKKAELVLAFEEWLWQIGGEWRRASFLGGSVVKNPLPVQETKEMWVWSWVGIPWRGAW